MVRVYKYRGKTYEEFRSMPMEEFAKLLTARQRRVLKRGLTDVQNKLLDKIKHIGNREKPLRTNSRDLIILPEMVGIKLSVHSGREYIPVTIIPEHVGHYLGELVLTRQRVKHGSPGFGATRGSKFVPLK
jgi:small subunit ribosomal protein S19